MTWHPPGPDDRKVAALWAVCAGLAVVLGPVLGAVSSYLPPCLFHLWTGLPCPGCGTTRAVTSLLQLRLLDAIAWNPLAAAGAMAFVGGGLAAPVWLALGGPALTLAGRPRPLAVAAAAALFAANWIWLAASGV